jgi:sodium/hydrogen exchanger-like protein 6/7
MIGIVVGLATSLLLKLTHVRRDPKTESCLIFLIAYASYFFANAIHMSGMSATTHTAFERIGREFP